MDLDIKRIETHPLQTRIILPLLMLIIQMMVHLNAQHDKGVDEGCLDCHGDLLESNVIHEPVSAGFCSACHEFDPKTESMRRTQGDPDICLDCHEDPRNGHLDHSALSLIGCLGCHQPHGSPNFRLLSNHYPNSLYAEFDIMQYGLCFDCHDSAAFTEPESDVTEFRDNKRNLHFLHVNKPRNGRSCRTCHEPHTGAYPNLIRSEVPYGTWVLPIQFEKTDSGGTCRTGCHQPRSYSRDTNKQP